MVQQAVGQELLLAGQPVEQLAVQRVEQLAVQWEEQPAARREVLSEEQPAARREEPQVGQWVGLTEESLEQQPEE